MMQSELRINNSRLDEGCTVITRLRLAPFWLRKKIPLSAWIKDSVGRTENCNAERQQCSRRQSPADGIREARDKWRDEEADHRCGRLEPPTHQRIGHGVAYTYKSGAYHSALTFVFITGII